jgi:hypothetical protein
MTMSRHKFRYDSEEYKETWRVYCYILGNRPYPTKQQVKDAFGALAEVGILADSFTQADVEKALAPYDTSDGLTINYPVKYAFLETMFKEFAIKLAAVRKAGGPGHDVEATMMFHKDVDAIRNRFDKLDGGDTRFVILAIDVGRADDAEWGFKDYADSYDVEKAIRNIEGWSEREYRLEKAIEAGVGPGQRIDILVF